MVDILGKIGAQPDAARIVSPTTPQPDAPGPVGLGFPTLTYVSRQILHLPFMRQGARHHVELVMGIGSDPA
jgi:hypothetical protein